MPIWRRCGPAGAPEVLLARAGRGAGPPSWQTYDQRATTALCNPVTKHVSGTNAQLIEAAV
eukprot:12625320-Alexandrium_andersonii.AAC.1